MRFHDQVVWITGASSGIGEALAIAGIYVQRFAPRLLSRIVRRMEFGVHAQR